MTTLSAREIETMRELSAYARMVERDCPGYSREDWARPMDVGGSDGSHHSMTLKRLTDKGVVERGMKGGHSRGSYRYRLTDAGRAALADIAANQNREKGQ